MLIHVANVFCLQLLVSICFSPECFSLTSSKLYPSFSVWIYPLIKAFSDFNVWYSTFSETLVKAMNVHCLKNFNELVIYSANISRVSYFAKGTVIGAGNTAVNKALVSLSSHHSRRRMITINK